MSQQESDKLTPREREVLEAVASGHSSKVIADQLGIAEYTVWTHRGNAYRKLRIHTVVQATRIVLTGLM